MRRALVLGAQLVVTAAVAWFIFDRVGLSLADLLALDLSRWTPRWGVLLLSCAALLAGYVVSGAIWGVMVHDLGGPRLPVGSAVRIYLVANLGRYIPGKVWQIAGLALLARRGGVSVPVAMTAAVLGQGIAVLAATLVGATALLGAGPRYREVGLWTLAVLLVGGVVALTPPVLRRLVALWLRLARWGASGPDAVDAADAVDPDGIDARPGPVLRWGLLYLVNWCLYALSFWIFVKSFNLPGTLLQVGPAFAAAYVLGYVAFFAPAGLGVREGALTALLGPVTGVTAAATVAIAARVWATAVEVVPAGALWTRRVTRTAQGTGREGDEPDDPSGVPGRSTSREGRGR